MPKKSTNTKPADVLELFAQPVREWFSTSFSSPTEAQKSGWPAIARGESTLILAPTGSGKTLTAFLWCLNQLMFSPPPEKERRCRVLYISPLKALAVDVERNLRSPLVGIANVATMRETSFHTPDVLVRTGDTPAKERARFLRQPSDILITTPESLYLILTSRARETLRSIETIIVDEIHALVPTKRGAHLALSLERLEQLCDAPPQRIGLSATQRPLEEVARFLGGVESRTKKKAKKSKAETATEMVDHEFEAASDTAQFRPVTIVDTAERKKLSMLVEVPVEDMARLGQPVDLPSGPASKGPVLQSIWPSIHPRLLELIRKHESTLIFVNSRRLAERLAAALNELGGENLVSAHHGSLAREQRVEIEDRLKLGKIKGLIATSSLELGIDMGAIDLVIQIEAPPSIASGMQRIGRASHQVGTVSSGIIFPKYRGDLLACAAVTAAMHEGAIEPIRYPRNPLDVLAQQIVAMVSMDSWNADSLYDALRSAAPYAELGRTAYDGVLDMLSGLYPSDEFAELRPRVTWDRVSGSLSPRAGAQKVAIVNGGTIPDRGLYGVFLAGAPKGAGRVGELDEEMVFESRIGETFVLGASTWRIEEIHHDRVLVSPAPGEPGKMPFWHGDSAGRTVEFGLQIGKLTREMRQLPRKEATTRLAKQHDLELRAAENLLQYLDDQKLATEAVPDDQTVVVERCRDELGDWLLCVLSPLGGRILAPWAMAAIAKVRSELAIDVEAMWSDDGFIIRFPETDAPPDSSYVLPTPDEVEQLLVQQLGASSVFAARFRENAARALLLPRRRPGGRTPLWQQRKRAFDLLQVASRFGSFPILLETYRDCLRDMFDLPALRDLLRRVERRSLRVVTVNTDRPSPFAGSLLFRYVANYLYDGDAPLAERRAQALAIDQTQLRELLGEAELRELLDSDSIAEIERRLQRLEPEMRAKTADGLHDLLLVLGDLSSEEVAARTVSEKVAKSVHDLVRTRRALELVVGGERRFIAIEDAARYRDALGIPLPAAIPDAFLREAAAPLQDLVMRYARTHPPFSLKQIAARFGVARGLLQPQIESLVGAGRLVEGEFLPEGSQREYAHPDVLRQIRRKSLAKLRREVEPVDQPVLARLVTTWQGVVRKRSGVNALIEAIELLQGAPLPASILESDILAARIEDYSPFDLDSLISTGEVVWTGIEPIGEHDGRIALYLIDAFSKLRRTTDREPPEGREVVIAEFLERRGASFFAVLHEGTGGGFPNDTLEAIWSLVWKGWVTNDSLHALRQYTRSRATSGRRAVRSRRIAPAGSEGRWSLVDHLATEISDTERRMTLAHQLLARYGVLTREAVAAESIRGGFSAVYDVLTALEDRGKIRRGYFVSGIGASQFAQPGAIDFLRALRSASDDPETILLAATDPANPYGSILKWPEVAEGRTPTRTVGASVILVNGLLGAYLHRGDKQMQLFLPDEEPVRSEVAREVARKLASLVNEGQRRAVFVAEVNGRPVAESPLAPYLAEAGFLGSAVGYQMRVTAKASKESAPN